jgi:NAD(P)-dependent dehydrogenase (short-subunit alcohol dehydrogenase family)
MAPPNVAGPLTTKVHHDIYPAISPDGALAGSAAGLNVLITGAGRGIGRAQAIIFAKAGASRVTIAARSEDELSEVEKAVNDLGTKCEVIRVRTDVTDEKSVQNLFNSAGDIHGICLFHNI